jgi:8-oxo-dGTP pyrophosphatase MutT (NUDIX family)
MSKAPTRRKKAAEAASDAQHQIAALPVRMSGGQLEICLVTTRETRRWTIPKGWPMKGKADRAAAAIEAREEAGLTGEIGRKPVGSYLYWKRRADHLDLVRVVVYRLDVSSQMTDWKEADERHAMWFPAETAAGLVEEPGLAALIGAFPAAG